MNRNYLLQFAAVFCVTLIFWAVAAGVRGDVLELKNGGRIEGRVIAGNDDAKADYVVETPTGRVTVARAQVAHVDATSDAEREYESLARTSPDTVEAHWKLYEFCRAHKLREQAQKHLSRILELDPEHAEARAILGFKKTDGQWKTRDEIMAARGMVKYEGQYYTRQQVELFEQQKATKMSQVDWRKKLEQLRRALTGNNEERAKQARTEIDAIRDPLAAEPVVALLNKETDRALVRMWLEVAARLDQPATIGALVKLSLDDADEEVRLLCLDYLIKSGRPGIATPYLQALGSSDNVTINRAAVALGKIGDPDTIGPLIEALVTTHKVKVSEGGQMSVSMSRGNSGMGMGGGPKFETHHVHNPDVLNSLLAISRITGFDYDQDAWRAWHVAQAKSHRIDMRRDE